MNLRLIRLMIVCLASAMVPLQAGAQAGDYPNRTITWVVPVGAGSGADFMARLIGPRLSERVRQPVVVENRPGASQVIGVDYAAKAAPNGYTLIMLVSNITMVPSLIKNVPFDLVADFAPVSRIATSSLILGVNTSVIAPKDIRELIAMVKANPGKFSYATPGNGTGQHVGMELLKLREGLDLLHVPHRNITEANTSLLGGSVHMMLGGSPQMKPLEATGKVRLVAITGPQRSPAAPEVPTFTETGFPYMSEVDAWWGVAVPAKTPAGIVARLNREMRDILALPEIPAALSKQGLTAVPSSPEEFQALIKADIERWNGVIRAAKITAD